MAYEFSSALEPAELLPSRLATRKEATLLPVKIVVAGGFGVGETTFVGSISEITPLTTEAAVTAVSAGLDDVHSSRGRRRPRSRSTSGA